MKKIFVIVVLISVLNSGCAVMRKRDMLSEFKRIGNCEDNWIYSDLKSNIRMKVLLFIPTSRFDISFYPSFTIGITDQGDTIAILDSHMETVINKDDIIRVNPLSIEVNKENKPLFTFFKDHRINDLFCSVKNVYYGEIQK